ncbi:hypothetical protein M3Y99_00490800 [Aphelenchoides fujianensis]|nr:hypothetical protein M3Y99_00490800 [Aphelenchoides fujianensis]
MMQCLLRGSFHFAFQQQAARCLSVSPALAKGHSKWQNIKDTKGKMDVLRSKKISFILNRVRQAVKQAGGFDMKLNRNLAALQQEFRANSLPLDTFNNFLVKLKEKPDQIVFYDLIGPSGTFVIIEAETDNVNRTKGAIQKHMSKLGGFRFGNDLRKRFEEKVFVTISDQQEGTKVDAQQLEEVAIEFDCEELKTVHEEDGTKFELQFGPDALANIEENFKSKGFAVEGVESRLIAHHHVAISDQESEVIDKFYSLLDEIEEVKNIYDNRVEPADDQPSQASM